MALQSIKNVMDSLGLTDEFLISKRFELQNAIAAQGRSKRSEAGRVRGRRRVEESRAFELREALLEWRDRPSAQRPSLRKFAAKLGTNHQLLSYYLERLDVWMADRYSKLVVDLDAIEQVRPLDEMELRRRKICQTRAAEHAEAEKVRVKVRTTLVIVKRALADGGQHVGADLIQFLKSVDKRRHPEAYLIARQCRVRKSTHIEKH